MMGLIWYCWGNNCEHFRLQRGEVLTCFCANQPCRNHAEAASCLWRTTANPLLSTHGKVLVNWKSKRWQNCFLQHKGNADHRALFQWIKCFVWARWTSTSGQGKGKEFGYSSTWGFILAIYQKPEGVGQERGNPTLEDYRAIFAGG